MPLSCRPFSFPHRPARLGAIVAAGLLLWVQAALAESATIELTDGSTLQGEVVSLKGGAYQIETRSLGIVRIPQKDVALVSYQPATTTPSNAAAATAKPGNNHNSSSAAALAQVQERLMANPGTLAQIMTLTDDAAVQAVINDPAIQAAISSGDFSGLMQNPKIRALMEHPTIKQISAQQR